MQAFEGFDVEGFDIVGGIRGGFEDDWTGARALIRVDANLSRKLVKSSALIAGPEVVAALVVEAEEAEVRRLNVAGIVPWRTN
jgi:hypothetical protein